MAEEHEEMLVRVTRHSLQQIGNDIYQATSLDTKQITTRISDINPELPLVPASDNQELFQPKHIYSTQDTSPRDDEDHVYPLGENIVLIGEERCVEDWPESSPVLDPNWEPPGKLRLRKESLKFATESKKGTSAKDADGPEKTIKGRKFLVPFGPRRGLREEGEKKRTVMGGEHEQKNCTQNQKGKKLHKGFFTRRDSKEICPNETNKENLSAAQPQCRVSVTQTMKQKDSSPNGDYSTPKPEEEEVIPNRIDVKLSEEADPNESDQEGREDTLSLKNWWTFVEQWDELPENVDGLTEEAEAKLLVGMAEKVQKGLRLFNCLFTEHAENLGQHLVTLNDTADELSSLHKKKRISGTPDTVFDQDGTGVALDRKNLESVIKDCDTKMASISRCLRFVWQGMEHLNLRSSQYWEDWEARRAVHMASVGRAGAAQAIQVSSGVNTALNSLQQSLEIYFLPQDPRKLKKGTRKELVGRLREAGKQLKQGLEELRNVQEELQDAIGYI